MPRSRKFYFFACLAALMLCWTECQAHAQQPTNKKPITRRPRTRQRTPAKRGLTKPSLGQKSKVKQAAATKRQVRPQKQPVLKVKKLSKEMEQILKDWEKKTAIIKRMSATVETHEKGTTFGVKKLGRGTVKFQYPDQASYQISGIKITKELLAREKKRDNMTLKPADAQRFVCTGKKLYQIDDVKKKYQIIPIPPNMQGERILDGPLPFLFGMKAEEAKRRFDFSKLKSRPNQIWLKAIPRRQEDLQNYKEARIVLDKKNFYPLFVQTTDTTGTSTTSYYFKNFKVNEGFFWKAIKPDKIKGYKLIITENGGPAPGRVKIGDKPAGRKSPAKPR